MWGARSGNQMSPSLAELRPTWPALEVTFEGAFV